MAKNTDHFIKAISAPPTKLSSAINDISTNIFLESLEGIQSDTAVVIVIDRVNGDGVQTPELTEVVIGTIGTNGLENVVRGVGGRQQAHKTGAVVEVSIASSEQWNRLISALLKTHNQDGTLKDNIIEGKHIRDNTVIEHKIANGAVTSNKISSGAVKPEHLHQTAKRLLISYKQGSASHTYANNGDCVLFDTKVYDKADGLIVPNNGVGSFRANYNGFMKLSATVWTANGAGNPWIKVLRRTTNSTVIQEAGAIGNTTHYYQTLNVSEAIFPVKSGDVIWVVIFSSNGNKPSTNGDSGGNHTMITMEALL